MKPLLHVIVCARMLAEAQGHLTSMSEQYRNPKPVHVVKALERQERLEAESSEVKDQLHR
jgi:hypothetical protein